VSVCVPAYNAARYVGRTIQSVLGQSFGDLELIVSDDASDDETEAVCLRYTDDRIRTERSSRRLGQAGNWNRCVELARGQYTMLLHADDELLPGCLEQAVSILDDNRDIGLVHCAVQHIDERNNRLTTQRLLDEDTIDREDVILRHLLLEGCVVNPAGVLVRSAAFDAAGPFTDQIVWGVDWHMWIRIALRFSIAYLAEPLALYRQHQASGTSAVMASGRNARDEMWALEDVFREIERVRPDLRYLKPAAIHGVAHRTWCHAERLCEAGDRRASRVALRHVVRISPKMANESRVWGLWLATYTGYRWFASAHAARQWAARKLAPARR
jgi:glycosyltransferase involved in cell wall biosynthesis